MTVDIVFFIPARAGSKLKDMIIFESQINLSIKIYDHALIRSMD